MEKMFSLNAHVSGDKSRRAGKNIIQGEKRFPKKHSDYLLKLFGFSNPQG